MTIITMIIAMAMRILKMTATTIPTITAVKKRRDMSLCGGCEYECV